MKISVCEQPRLQKNAPVPANPLFFSENGKGEKLISEVHGSCFRLIYIYLLLDSDQCPKTQRKTLI